MEIITTEERAWDALRQSVLEGVLHILWAHDLVWYTVKLEDKLKKAKEDEYVKKFVYFETEGYDCGIMDACWELLVQYYGDWGVTARGGWIDEPKVLLRDMQEIKSENPEYFKEDTNDERTDERSTKHEE